jgi:hypothetical protein
MHSEDWIFVMSPDAQPAEARMTAVCDFGE